MSKSTSATKNSQLMVMYITKIDMPITKPTKVMYSDKVKYK